MGGAPGGEVELARPPRMDPIGESSYLKSPNLTRTVDSLFSAVYFGISLPKLLSFSDMLSIEFELIIESLPSVPREFPFFLLSRLLPPPCV